MKKKVMWRIIGVFVLFGVTLLVLLEVLPLLPGFEAMPAIVALGLPLGLAWVTAVGVGENFVPARQALAVATVCLIVATPFVWWSESRRAEQEYTPVWTPPVASPPENVPENMVAFRFVSAFTYLDGAGSISNVELELPWPYIDDRDEFGRPLAYPVGLDNWLVKEDLSVALAGLSPPSAKVEWDVWRLDLVSENTFEELENLLWEYKAENDPERLAELFDMLDFRLENAVWSIDISLWRLPLQDLGFASVKRYRNGTAVGGGATAYFKPRANSVVFYKVTVEVPSMRPGDTVAVEGIFYIHKENANKVRLDDWIESAAWRTFKPEQENAPYVSYYWEAGKAESIGFVSQLEKAAKDDLFLLVVKYEETGENKEAGIYRGGMIDDEILRQIS